MHDPMTVAFRLPGITVWHVDPERDGTDDSCGWFKRSRHGDPETLNRIKSDLASEWDGEYGGWFNSEGEPRYSVQAITLMMFRRVAWAYFKSDWGRTEAFMRNNLYDILHFAENNVDSLCDAILLLHGPVPRDRRIEQMAHVLYGWILRAEQRWWQHPRYHFWHWRIQIRPLQDLKRWLFSRCCVCGKRFTWGYCPVSRSWDSDGPRWFRGEPNVYHHHCGGSNVRMPRVQGNGSSG